MRSLSDGVIEVALNEERLSRKKLHIGYPALSIEKVLELRDPKVFDSKLKEYRNNYKKVLLSEEEYYKEFKNKMDYALDKTC